MQCAGLDGVHCAGMVCSVQRWAVCTVQCLDGVQCAALGWAVCSVQRWHGVHCAAHSHHLAPHLHPLTHHEAKHGNIVRTGLKEKAAWLQKTIYEFKKAIYECKSNSLNDVPELAREVRWMCKFEAVPLDSSDVGL